MRDNHYLDEGTPTWRRGLSDLACLDTGSLPAEALLDLPGAEGEEMLFLGSPTGRLMPAAFAERVSDLRANGMRDPVNNQPSLTRRAGYMMGFLAHPPEKVRIRRR